jgi:hypothetical protein
MFTFRAVETSRSSFLARYRFILCCAGIATLAFCLSPKAFATTYHAASVSCLSGTTNNGQTAYEEPQSDPLVPTTANPAVLIADVDAGGLDGAQVVCTWKNFGSGTSPAGATLYVSGRKIPTFLGGYVCLSGMPATISSSLGTLYAPCSQTTYTGASYVLPTGTNLSTFSVTGTSMAHGADDTVELDIGSLYIQ